MTENSPTIAKGAFTLEQGEDCCGRIGHDHQYIEIETEDSGAGSYYVMKTERWAFDSLDDLKKQLKLVIGEKI